MFHGSSLYCAVSEIITIMLKRVSDNRFMRLIGWNFLLFLFFSHCKLMTQRSTGVLFFFPIIRPSTVTDLRCGKVFENPATTLPGVMLIRCNPLTRQTAANNWKWHLLTWWNTNFEQLRQEVHKSWFVRLLRSNDADRWPDLIIHVSDGLLGLK